MQDPDAPQPAPPDKLEIALDPVVVLNKIEYPRLILGEPTLNQVQQAHMKLDDALPSPGAMRDYEITFVAAVLPRMPRAAVELLPVRPLQEAVDYLQRFVTCDLPPASDELADEYLLALDEPILANGGEVTQLLLREPRGGELAKAEALLGRGAPLPGNVRRYQARLIQEVSGAHALAVGQLPIRKAREAIRYLEGFVNSAPATGRS